MPRTLGQLEDTKMAINFAKPDTTDNYLTEFVPNLQANQVALGQWLDSTYTTISGSITSYTKRYNRSSGYLQEYVSGAWANINLNITGNALTATTAAAATGGTFLTALAVTEGSIGARVVGYNDAYLFNNSSGWGMYSITGGAAFSYSRATSTFTFNGACSANSGTVTNGVYTIGDQSIAGIKNLTNQLRVSSGSASVPSIAFSADGATDTGLYWGGDGIICFANNGVQGGYISPGGNLVMTGNVSAYSDSRIKNNLLRIDNALDKVCKLTGYTYDRTDVKLKRQTGLIAQDVLRVLPEAVEGTEDTVYSVSYGSMLGLIVEAIKDLKREIEYLK